MNHTIGIRYRTPHGTEGTWRPLTSSDGLRGKVLDDKTLAAFLAYWHPDYTYLGRETEPTKEQE